MGRVGTHRNDFFFIFSISRPFPTYFGLKWSYDGVLKFFEIFCYFFGIAYSRSSRNPSERLFLFFLFLGLSNPILAWKEAMMVFPNFLNFFGILYYGMGRNASEGFFFSFFLNLSQPILAWKEPMMLFSNFLNFFAIFLEFSIPGRVETHRNDYFYFFSFSAFQILFWLEKKLWWCFQIFWIFLEFSITGRVGTHRKDFFFFFISSLSEPFPTCFGSKRSYDGVF